MRTELARQNGISGPTRSRALRALTATLGPTTAIVLLAFALSGCRYDKVADRLIGQLNVEPRWAFCPCTPN